MKKATAAALILSAGLFLFASCSISEPESRVQQGEYIAHPIEPSTALLAENGLYLQYADGEEKLLFNLGQNYMCFFVEEDYLYVVGPHLERYDLAAEDPESTLRRTQIMPLNTDVIQVLSHDEEWIYVRARMWNENDNRHDEPKTYAARRDGAEYKEAIETDAAQTPTAAPTKSTDAAEESYFNPYNYFTESDGEHVFYTELTGIYKIPNDGSGAEKIVDGKTIVSITLHNSTIYYIDGADLYKAGKDGANQMTLDIPYKALRVACLNDILYIKTSDGYYTANVASNADVLTLAKQPGGRPAPNGVFYSMESIPGREIGCNLYRISPDTGEKTEILADVMHWEYIITDHFIFYHDEDGVYKADLDGQNSVKLIDGNDTDISLINFYNYDDQWLYAGLTPGGFSRIDQETGAVEPLVFDANPGGFDIVDGYLYGYDSGVKVRMKLPDGSVEFAPFR